MSRPDFVVRPARVADTNPILTLVNELALRQIMLPRSPASVIENIRDFLVAEVDGRLAGCGALAVTWTDLGEVRSLAVHPDHQKLGIGRALVDALIADARQLGLPQLFAFTYVPDFFEKVGFSFCQHEDLPHKVFNDCMHCPKFLACDEIAMTRVLDETAGTRQLLGRPQRAIPLPQRTAAFGQGQEGAISARPVQATDDAAPNRPNSPSS